ncbi:hypothetical protein [Blastococcus colisei]|uniref:hypothetical protein n=1 Tax=Blastococcus colisei TaxID=1564162 RepID=UPI001B884EA5|nr:hypothetical protein [Blastococcus colisei]
MIFDNAVTGPEGSSGDRVIRRPHAGRPQRHGEAVEQHELLDRVLPGPLLTMPTLLEHEVRWTTRSTDRKPDYTSPAAAEMPSDQLL